MINLMQNKKNKNFLWNVPISPQFKNYSIGNFVTYVTIFAGMTNSLKYKPLETSAITPQELAKERERHSNFMYKPILEIASPKCALLFKVKHEYV